MAITRDPDFPVEIANLVQAFNHCADGHDANTVLNASLQTFAASIAFICKQRSVTLIDAETYTRRLGELAVQIVRDNWDRKTQPTDIEVRLG